MNCRQATRLLPVIDPGGLTPRRSEALATHLAQCDACRDLQGEHEEVLELLAAYTPPALPAGFGAQLHARLEAEARHPRRNETRPLPALEQEPRRRRVLRALAYAAAGLLLGAFATWGLLRTTHHHHQVTAPGGVARLADPAGPTATLRLGEVAVVTLSLEARAHYPGAELELVLPDGLALVGEDLEEFDEKQLRWTEPLRPGVNLIRVPVRARRPGTWTLVARARSGRIELASRARLRVTRS